MSAISEVFSRLDGEKALVAYVMGGDPSIELTGDVIDAVVAGGADIIEVGIPFSDPIADGKSIQAAGVRALSAGTTPDAVLKAVKDAKSRHDVPIAVMTYYNILFSRGLEHFLEKAMAHNVDGLIVPDLPLDETSEYVKLARKTRIDTILLAAPTSPPARLRRLASQTSGFLYLVSLLGVTGARAEVGASTIRLVHRAMKFTEGKVPLAVGFGISEPEHVRAVLRAGADAAIVGSGIVNRVAKYEKSGREMLDSVETYIRSLKSATKE